MARNGEAAIEKWMSRMQDTFVQPLAVVQRKSAFFGKADLEVAVPEDGKVVDRE